MVISEQILLNIIDQNFLIFTIRLSVFNSIDKTIKIIVKFTAIIELIFRNIFMSSTKQRSRLGMSKRTITIYINNEKSKWDKY